MPERAGSQHVDRVADVWDAGGFHQLDDGCLLGPEISVTGACALWANRGAWQEFVSRLCAKLLRLSKERFYSESAPVKELLMTQETPWDQAR